MKHGDFDVKFCISFIAGVAWRWFTCRFDPTAAVLKLLARPSRWEAERYLKLYVAKWDAANQQKKCKN